MSAAVKAVAVSPIARPVIKCVGGKAWLVPELLRRIPPTFGRYFEPLAGGAALFFTLRPERAVLVDANADLIAMYRALRAVPEAVIELLARHAERHGPKHYADVVEAWNSGASPGPAARAAAYLYMNRAGFNGLWRVNRRGEYNVGFGKGELARFNTENLRLAARALAGADLRAGDYRAIVESVSAGDVVYLDPPYDGTFSAYTAVKFAKSNQVEVAYTARKLAERGARVIVSNADTPDVRLLYAGWHVAEVSRRGTMSCDGAGRGRVGELLITSPGWQ